MGVNADGVVRLGMLFVGRISGESRGVRHEARCLEASEELTLNRLYAGTIAEEVAASLDDDHRRMPKC